MALTKNDLQAIKSLVHEVVHDELSVGLKPLKDDIAEIKHVTEHRIYKEMKEGFKFLNERIDMVENQMGVILEDHESRIKRLEETVGISS